MQAQKERIQERASVHAKKGDFGNILDITF